MYREMMEKLINRENLSENEMVTLMNEIMSGKLTDSQIAGILTALRAKGETREEITGCAKVMREKASKVNVQDKHAIDTCGTGGDGKHTFNVSTLAAIVAAAAGVTVVKHGNRSVSSKCGSADVLADLGVNIDMDPQGAERCLEQAKITFLFAPKYHPSMKYVMKARRELGVRTIFNILGPLANPGMVNSQIIGVFDEKLTEIIAQVLKELGLTRALIIHGMDGLDEISISAGTKVSELKDGEIKTYYIEPENFGFKRGNIDDIKGGDPEENARMIISLLKGGDGTVRDIILINAGAAIYMGGKADSIMEGIQLARVAIDSGSAMDKLNEFIRISQEVA